MGKQARSKRTRAAEPAPPAAIVVRPPDPIEPPAFWFGFEVPWAKLAFGRVVFFALLALDALLAIRHAPRYGAGGFNVAQLPFLDGLGPTRAAYVVCELALAYLFTLAACGVATRAVVPIGAAIYGWLYFGSQLDSYQHHYLVALLLVIASFVPWQRPSSDAPVRSWALRLFLVQLGIMYGYAAVSKMSGAWLDGRTLGVQINATSNPDLRALIDHTIGIAAVSKLVLVTELVLAATVWTKRFGKYVAPIGIAFHAGILIVGFDIGLFAWIMMAVYAFVLPDALYTTIAGSPPVRALAALANRARDGLDGGLGVAVFCLALPAGVTLAALVRFDHAGMVGVGVVIVPIVMSLFGGRGSRFAWLGIAHVVAIVTWLAIDRTTTVAVDYDRFWGGAARRLGDKPGAIRAYRAMIAIAPDDPVGHYQLGRLLLDDEHADEGLAELRASQKLDSAHARAYVAEARWLAAHGKKADAIDKAKEATYAEPSNAEAQAYVEQLTGGKKAPTPAAGSDD